MAAADDIKIPLEPGKFFHIFNRGNNKAILFFKKKNYLFFLKRYKEFLLPFVDTYSYCLIPNHFHLLVQIKTMDVIFGEGIKRFKKPPKTLFDKSLDYGPYPTGISFEDWLNRLPFDQQYKLACWIVSEQFRRFFMSYTKAINKQEGREGSLFRKYFRRKLVDEQDYFQNLVWYIHHNPTEHALVDDFTSYDWSSYQAILEPENAWLAADKLLHTFGGVPAFIQFSHLQPGSALPGSAWEGLT